MVEVLVRSQMSYGSLSLILLKRTLLQLTSEPVPYGARAIKKSKFVERKACK